MNINVQNNVKNKSIINQIHNYLRTMKYTNVSQSVKQVITNISLQKTKSKKKYYNVKKHVIINNIT